MNKEILDYVKELTTVDTKTLSQKCLKLFEEGGELSKKVLPFEDAAGTLHRYTNRGEVLEEVADVILVALSVGYNIGMTDEELNDFMLKKAKYWQEIQHNEIKASKILPYEIHVTVDFSKYNKKDKPGDYNFFVHACAEIGVKPLLLKNYSSINDTVETAVMSSKTMRGTAREADKEMETIAKGLKDFCFSVSRKKIETVPWHPAGLKALTNEKFYFENHLKVKIKETRFKTFIKQLKKSFVPNENTSFGISWNALKDPVDGVRTYFVTLRSKNTSKDRFESLAKSFIHSVKEINSVLEVTSENIELAVFDSNEDQDKSWIIS